ncbi:MAG: PEP-CTERM sorting domain-containing protein [Betaproteobacteria bacterium]|nr:PEP-CTERM sorting domain-containing protein [Betaproteobacteria bacterium]
MKRAKLALVAKVSALVLAGVVCGTASAKVVEREGMKLAAMDMVTLINANGGLKVTVAEFTGNTNLKPSWKVATANDQNIMSSIYNYDDGWRTGAGAYRRQGFVDSKYYFVTTQMAPTITFNVCGNTNKCDLTAKLNLTAKGTGYVTKTDYPTSDATLTVGAAYLYAQYVLGGSYGDQVPFNNSIGWTQLTYADSNPSKGAWTSSDPYLKSLLAINPDKNYWLADYDPTKFYTEIGGYSVFVLNLYSGKTAVGNMLFLSAVPEPETYAMLLAGLGVVGIVARRRRNAVR